MHQETFEADDTSLYMHICGYKDKNLKQIEKHLEVTLIPRGNTIIIQSETDAHPALDVLKAMADYITGKDNKTELDDFEVRYIISAQRTGHRVKSEDINRLKIYIPDTG